MTKQAIIDSLIGDYDRGSIWAQWIHSTFYGSFSEYIAKIHPELLADCEEE